MKIVQESLQVFLNGIEVSANCTFNYDGTDTVVTLPASFGGKFGLDSDDSVVFRYVIETIA